MFYNAPRNGLLLVPVRSLRCPFAQACGAFQNTTGWWFHTVVSKGPIGNPQTSERYYLPKINIYIYHNYNISKSFQIGLLAMLNLTVLRLQATYVYNIYIHMYFLWISQPPFTFLLNSWYYQPSNSGSCEPVEKVAPALRQTCSFTQKQKSWTWDFVVPLTFHNTIQHLFPNHCEYIKSI